MTEEFDDLDRALFALPLEEPPPGLRASILRSTVGAHVRSRTLPFATWEIVALGTAIAVSVWLLLLVFWNKPSAVAFTADIVAVARGLGDPTTVLWLAAGGAVAAWFSFAGSVGLARKRT